MSNPARNTAKLDVCIFLIPKGSTKRITQSVLYTDSVSSITGHDCLIVLELSIHQNSQSPTLRLLVEIMHHQLEITEYWQAER